MIETSLIESASGQELYIAQQNGDKILITHTHAQVDGVFKAATRSSAGTSIITEPDADGCIVLTDIMVTSDRVAASSFTVQFTDGTETIKIISGNANDAPVNLSTSFAGAWKGWRNARLELITVGNVTATVACGYFKLHDSMLYSEWDALR